MADELTPSQAEQVNVQAILAQIAAKDEAARGAALPPGQALYDQEIAPGMRVGRRQPHSLIRHGETPLPDRVLCYERLTGREKRFSTTLLAKKLAIRDHEGGQKFVIEKPDLPPPEFIKESCEVCIRRGVRKRFIHKWDYVAHMETFHEREWRIIKEEQQERAAISTEALRAALEALSPEERRQILGGANGNHTRTTEASEGSGDSEVRQSHEGTVAECPDCGWQSKPVQSPAASLGTHQRFHCPKRPVLAGSGAN